MDAHTLAQQRALKLNQKHHKRSREKIESTKFALLTKLSSMYGDKWQDFKNASMGDMWREFVKTRNDAEAFMEVMYPSFEKPVQLAYVHMFERAINGEIKLDDRLIYKKAETDTHVWNPLKDIEDERMKGILNNTEKCMEQLLKE